MGKANDDLIFNFNIMETMNIYQKLFEVKKENISLQRDTKAFNYKYATLDQIQKKLGPVLEKNNLVIIHQIKENKVITKIINIENTDETIESEIIMAEGTKAQDKGSEITYYRRYNLLSLLDLEVEDDDGKKAQDSKVINTKKEVKWYNLKEGDLQKIQDKLLESGKKPQDYINGLIKSGYSLGAETKKAILTLG